MGLFLLYYVIAIVVFFAIDIVWLALVAKKTYQTYLGHLLKKDTDWIAAIVFYLIFIAGIVFFVINPAIEKNSWSYALGVGALFGLITYSTYDLTNLATLKDWPVKITIIDLVWGSFLTSMTSLVVFLIAQLIT
ncbi:MAG TPA: DUF2177 family protein [Bacilli bacterium]|nr:DUF2177 family protein [Bacilli bacterium]